MIKNLSEKPIAELQNEQADKWEKDDLSAEMRSTNAKVSRRSYSTRVLRQQTASPGIHHVIARTLKDSVCRYKTMKGFAGKA